jgi:predicted phage terminase large subunit-like protein
MDAYPSKEFMDSLSKQDRQRLILDYSRQSLAAYTRLMMPSFERARHHDKLFEILHAIEAGEKDRVIVSCPPRHSKSTLVNEMFSAWYLGRHPDHQVICTTYAQKLADSFGRKVRNHIRNPLHHAVFPKCELSLDSRSVQTFMTTAGGVYRAVGRGGSITGHGAHLCIVDDPLRDRQEATSDTIRETLNEWFTSTLYTRLMPGGKMIVVMTRWDNDDLVGHITSEFASDGWEEIRMPAIAEDGSDGWRVAGDALWPEWYPLSVPDGEQGQSLDRIRRTLGERDFNCLYQQRPTGLEGGMFKYEWLDGELYRDIPVDSLRKLILVDPATTKKKSSDYTAMVVVGLAQDRHAYVLDVVKDRLNLVERKAALFRLIAEWDPYVIGYEQYAAQADVPYIQEMMTREIHKCRIIELGGNRIKKQERIERLVPWFESGRLHWPHAMWRERLDGTEVDLTEEFRNDEYGLYPACAHDDVLDALSRMLDESVPLVWPLKESKRVGSWDGNATAQAPQDSWLTL